MTKRHSYILANAQAPYDSSTTIGTSTAVATRFEIADQAGSLKNWLAHSQKKYCEICGHKYAFTKGKSLHILPTR